MAFDVAEVISNPNEAVRFMTNTWRPYGFRKDRNRKATIAVNKDNEVIANSFLSQEQWQQIDAAVQRAAARKFNAWSTITGAGLITRTTAAEMSSKWPVGSEMTAAHVTLDFETKIESDRVDQKWYNQPLPIISKSFSIGKREMMSYAALGADLETVNAEEATAAVVEKAEGILLDGDTSIVVDSAAIYGMRTLGARYTTTADGDFGTLSNIYETFRKWINTMHTRAYHGPFAVWMAPNQYSEMQQVYTDGTGETALTRVQRNFPEIQSVNYNDLMTDGSFCALQLTSNVVDIRIAQNIEVRRWESPDGSRIYFVVLMIAVPRLRTDYAGYSGVVHITSA